MIAVKYLQQYQKVTDPATKQGISDYHNDDDLHNFESLFVNSDWSVVYGCHVVEPTSLTSAFCLVNQ